MITFILVNVIAFHVSLVAMWLLMPKPIVRIGLSAKWQEYKRRTFSQHCFHITIASLLITLFGAVLCVIVLRATYQLRALDVEFPKAFNVPRT